MLYLLISFMFVSGMSCIVNSSINAVSPFLAVVGAHRPAITTVNLQIDNYLQHSVIQFLVNIVGSYLVNSAKKSAWRFRIPVECILVASDTGHRWCPECASFRSGIVDLQILVQRPGGPYPTRHTYLSQTPRSFPCFCLLPFSVESH
jgi:hypothetical protein